MKKRLLSFAAAIFLLVSLFPNAAADVPRSLQMAIIHTGDAHSRVTNYPALAQLKSDTEASVGPVLLLDSGDTFHGLPFANLEEGASIAEVMKQIGYDAMAAGNHDFNFGWKRLQELGGLADLDILAANVVDEAGQPVFKEYAVYEYGQYKIGVFGLSSEETAFRTAPANTRGLQFLDPAETAQKMVAFLEEQEADYIIALTHIGSDTAEGYTVQELAVDAPGIDFILDGHTHNELDGQMVGDTMICADGQYLDSAGKIVIGNGKAEYQRVRFTDASPVDQALADTIASVNERQASLLSEIVGECETVLNAERSVVRSRETQLGDLICDAYLDESGADIAIENGGGVRQTIGGGPITKGDILAVAPYGNLLVTKEITGAELKKFLETYLPYGEALEGSYPQVGGIRLVYDSTKPQGQRVSELAVGGAPAEDAATYVLATNSYVAEAFEILKDKPQAGQYGACDEILLRYFSKGAYELETQPRVRLTAAVDWLLSVDGILIQGPAPVFSGTKPLLPLRAVLENAGYTVTWNPVTRTATAVLGEQKIQIHPDSSAAELGGVPESAESRLTSGVTYVEMEFLAKALDRSCAADGFSRSIILYA